MNEAEARELVKASAQFDADWYSTKYPDVAKSGLDPVDHFLRIGAKLGRDPGPHFSSRRYLNESPDVARAGINPLYHYLKWGRAEGRPVFGSTQRVVKKKSSSPAPAAKKENAETQHNVTTLIMELWGGYARYSLAPLEQIKLSKKVSKTDRANAAFGLMQWYFVQGDIARAYENIELFNVLSTIRLNKRYVTCAAHCLIKLGRYNDAIALLDAALAKAPAESDYWFIRAAVERSLSGAIDAEERQLMALRQSFELMGLAPISKKDPSQPLSFSNIVAHPGPGPAEQSLKVSVIIPAFAAESTIGYAVESLQLQTWRNIEIIVVDDYSSDRTCEIVAEMAAKDPRVKLIAKKVNEGAYPARNTGLAHVTGDLIMVHDSDDWSHPQKIEEQIKVLQASPSAVAVMSMWLRVDDDFVPSVHARPVAGVKSLSYPSLLFKRKVIDEIGPWPAVRVSGDSEFKSRLENFYGPGAIVNVDNKVALSLSLSREDSLTQQSVTHINTLHFGLRWHYRRFYHFLHRSGTAESGRIRQLENNVLLANRSKRVTEHDLDLLFVADFATEKQLLGVIETAAEQGATVGIYHWCTYGGDVNAPLSDAVYALCVRYNIVILTPSDSANAKAVVLARMSIAEWLQDRFPRVSTESLVVLVDQCNEGKDSTLGYDLSVAQANLAALFGKIGAFVAADETVKRLVRRHPSVSLNKAVWSHIAETKMSGKSTVLDAIRALSPTRAARD